MLMSMLYDINFIIGLLITLMLSTFAYFYFSQKIDEQKEKLNAVSMVVRAMAEEMAYFRNTGQAALAPKGEDLTEGGEGGRGATEGGSGQTETKVFEIGLANIGINGPANNLGGSNNLEERSNELQLIAVSDDEDSDSDQDSDDQSETDSDEDSDEEDDDTELCSIANTDVDIEEVEVVDLEDYKKEENIGSNGNIKSIKLDMNLNMGDLEELGIFEGLDATTCKLDVTETKVIDVAALQPLIDDDQMKAETTDYKKMPLNKLRTIVVEKKLCDDASKMKKPELLELLKPFIGNMD